jgi:putative redox protein
MAGRVLFLIFTTPKGRQMAITARTITGYQVEISDGKHTIISDEPVPIGTDEGMGPVDLLLAALASCVVITLHMYAGRKKWPLERVDVKLTVTVLLAKDCPDCNSPPDEKVTVIQKQLTYTGDLNCEQKERLTEISDRCPVHRMLEREFKINSFHI